MVLKIGIVYNQPELDDRKDRSGVLEAVKDISTAIEKLGFSKVPIPIKDGKGFSQLIEAARDVDCIFNLFEDFAGDSKGEAWMAGLLEMLGIPYTGSDPEALILSLNKVRTKEILNANTIPTPSYIVIESPPKGSIPLKYPLIIKPPAEDGSLGIEKDNVIYDKDSLHEKCKELLSLYPLLLIEEFIEDREINAAILNGEVIALGEVFFAAQPAIISYSAKWDKHSPEDRATPTFYTNELKGMEDVTSLATRAFHIMGLRDYGRVDIRIDKDSQPFVIDVNPNPDISGEAGYARSLKAAGILYNDFIQLLILNAIERLKKR